MLKMVRPAMPQLWMIPVFISAHFLSPIYCTDKMFVTEASNAEIFMAEAIDYSFANTSFIKIPLDGLAFPVGVEYDPRSELIYWTDAKLHTVNRAALDGSSQEVIAQLQTSSGDHHYPYGIALNLDDDKVYWMDQHRDVIWMANLDGTSMTEILTTGYNSNPIAIVYSSIRRKIFWTVSGQYPKIEMANADGTERVTLLDGDLDSNFTDPTGICLDPTEQNIYWTDTTENTIEHLDLDDRQRATSLQFVSDGHPFGVAKYFEDIYFSDHLYDGVYAIDFPAGNLARVDIPVPVPVAAEIHIYADTSCPGGNNCASTGTCIINRRQPDITFRCICNEGYTGDHCESNINNCDPDPCMNGGTCTDGINAFTCDCVAGYTDSTCFTDINNCDPDPCMNGGTCADRINSFTCDCVAGYIDSTCSTDINDCDSDPCMNGGTCTDGINSFTCDCVAGYTDSTCSTAIDRCFYDDPCGVNEECTNTDLTEVGYYCNCSGSLERRNDVCMASRAIGGSVKFTRLNGQEVIFTDSLNDPKSEAYRNLADLCYKILYDVLMNIVNSQNNGWDVEIAGFSSGSVVVDFEVMVFDSDRANLNDQAAAVETSLGLQQPGVWQTTDGSVSLNVESIVAFGEICLTNPCSNGVCVTSPGDIDYSCICHYGYTGQHCETEVNCPLPNHPFSHVILAQSVYTGNDFVTIQCDDKEEYVVWQCNGTSGNWIQLTNLDCRPESEGRGLSTGVIFGIVVGIVVILGMIFCFLYKMAQMKRQPAIDERKRNRGRCPEPPIPLRMESQVNNSYEESIPELSSNYEEVYNHEEQNNIIF